VPVALQREVPAGVAPALCRRGLRREHRSAGGGHRRRRVHLGAAGDRPDAQARGDESAVACAPSCGRPRGRPTGLVNPLRLPLLDWRVVTVLALAAIGCTVAALVGRKRRFLLVVAPLLVLGTALLIALFAAVVDVPAMVDSGFPRSFYVWAALPIAMLAIAGV